MARDDALLANPIIVLGAPRSGTTWLAKILDSHPGVLYRHEPDTLLPPNAGLTGAAIPALLRAWFGNRGQRVVTKRPFFAKTWQPLWAYWLRTALVALLDIAARIPASAAWAKQARLPDFAYRRPDRLLIKSIAFAGGAGILASTLPDSRTIFILRHPCGQVASVMRGNRQKRFDLRTSGTDMPFDEAAAVAHAAVCGVTEAAFQALPDAAKYAWSWRAFNETAYAGLAGKPNVHTVVYEALCAEPAPMARQILAFAGLGWNDGTAAFLARSTRHKGAARYYTVYRDAITAAQSWRTDMDPSDIAAVRAVVSTSPLARFWPDLGLDP